MKISFKSPWKVTFDAANNRLQLVHNQTALRISGAISMSGQSQSEYGKHGSWHFGDACADQKIPILDGLNFRRAWLQPVIEGDALVLNLIPRGSARFTGSLYFEGVAELGAQSFACRTAPIEGGDVVQISSGNADSLLNDSIFDIDLDAAVQFSAGSVAISTVAAKQGGQPSFKLNMVTPVRTAFSPAMKFTAIPNYYRTRYSPDYVPVTKKTHREVPTGWMPWNTYFGDAGEKENLAEARLGAKKLKPYGMKFWYVESWEKNGGLNKACEMSHLSLQPHKELFPSGMKHFADEIRKLGFEPGIWSCPFGCGDKEFYEARRSWFLHDKQGQPLANWCGHYIVDPSNAAVIRHIEDMYRTMTHEWGFVLHKVDGTSANNTDYSSVFFDREDVQAAFSRKCDDPMRRILKAVRKGAGDQALLLWCCGDPSGPDAALGDAARIGADVVARFTSPTWRNYVDQAGMTLVHLMNNNILWYNDPDTLLVGDYAPLESARVATAVVGLTGQAMIASDKLAQLPDERLWLLQRCLPVCPTRPLDLFPIHDLKSIWDLKIRRPFAQWDVVSVFNFNNDSLREAQLSLSEIGLDPAASYHVFDFWNRKWLGTHTDSISLTIAPQSNALLAIHPDLKRPQFISTDRHISQGGTSIRQIKWDPKREQLSGDCELVAGETTTLWFHVPRNWKASNVEATGAKAGMKTAPGGLLKVTLEPSKAGFAKWRIAFEPKGKR